MVKLGIFVMFYILVEMLKLCPIQCDARCRFAYVDFIMLRNAPPIPILFKSIESFLLNFQFFFVLELHILCKLLKNSYRVGIYLVDAGTEE